LLEYIQKANAYTLFYLFVSDERVWYTIGKEPYRLPTVWKQFPKSFDIDLISTYNNLKHLYWRCIK